MRETRADVELQDTYELFPSCCGELAPFRQSDGPVCRLPRHADSRSLRVASSRYNDKVHIFGQLSSKATDGDSSDIEKSAERILSTVDTLYSSARTLVKRLRPETIDMPGLRGAIEEMVRHYDELHPECRFELRVGPDFPKLSEQLAIAAYRLVQEALSNVVKHSQATAARVLLEKCSENSVRIIVEDDGCGFDPRSKSSGIGLIGMRERVASAGGNMTIASYTLDRGVKLVIELPLTVAVELFGRDRPQAEAR